MSVKDLEILNRYFFQINGVLNNLPIENVTRTIELIRDARLERRRVFIFGNGGSATTASHFVTDLSKGTIADGKAKIKALALTDNVSLITAWANDTAYDKIFAEQLENMVEPEDIVIGISSSGNSPNVLNGIELAKSKGAITIGFSGFRGGKLAELSDISIIVPCDNTQQIEDIHLLLSHIIFTCLREDNK
jgi:D-sedoheptulose 7-phosphate isomerase